MHRQLTTGARKFHLDYMTRYDLACLTREAAVITGIPYATEVDAKAVEEILA